MKQRDFLEAAGLSPIAAAPVPALSASDDLTHPAVDDLVIPEDRVDVEYTFEVTRKWFYGRPKAELLGGPTDEDVAKIIKDYKLPESFKYYTGYGCSCSSFHYAQVYKVVFVGSVLAEQLNTACFSRMWFNYPLCGIFETELNKIYQCCANNPEVKLVRIINNMRTARIVAKSAHPFKTDKHSDLASVA
jgi:hypothetical protein